VTRNRTKFNEWRRRWRAANPEKERAAKLRHRERHITEIKAYEAQYRDKNRERMNLRDRNKYWADPEKGRIKSTNYRLENPKKYKATRAKWYAEHGREYACKRYAINPSYGRKMTANYRMRHPEKVHELQVSWYQKNPDAGCRYVAKRRALKAGATIGDLELIKEWEKTWRKKDLVKCYWCGGTFRPKSCCSDHVIPLSKGGSHSIKNLVISCRNCNQRKHNLLPEQWKEKLVGGSNGN